MPAKSIVDGTPPCGRQSELPIFIAGEALPQSAQQNMARAATTGAFVNKFFFSIFISLI
jgi:hypothetical protein